MSAIPNLQSANPIHKRGSDTPNLSAAVMMPAWTPCVLICPSSEALDLGADALALENLDAVLQT